ncbi:MAG: caspase family protein, partial [Bacteroidales bacterium]|nr:caspase family protein [Bacteroidales bacterium]
ELIIAQYVVLENQSAEPNNQIDINEVIDVKLAIQNIGQGKAENVKIKIENNQKGVMLLGVVNGEQLIRENPYFPVIQSGKYETVIYRYFVNSEFTDNQLQFFIKSQERIGDYGFSEVKSFSINKELEEAGFIRTVAKVDNDVKGEVIIEDIPEFISDVDIDIPETQTEQINTYALIIGNEDYKSKQKDLTIEQNVDYAVNDAQIFATYCEKTLGIPKKQIKLIKNATSAEINQGLAWISNLSKIEKGNAKLIFYYSGHGLPHEQTKEAYIIPVDVSGNNIDFAIKIANIYKKLTEYPSQQVSVFLDACFSGGARNKSLISMKGVKIKPKSDLINGNLVVFSSSTGDESSAVYNEKQHGFFTYYLLKKLKETKGSVNYDELSNYIIQSVSKETGLKGKIQTPQINVSHQVANDWKTWKLK